MFKEQGRVVEVLTNTNSELALCALPVFRNRGIRQTLRIAPSQEFARTLRFDKKFRNNDRSIFWTPSDLKRYLIQNIRK